LSFIIQNKILLEAANFSLIGFIAYYLKGLHGLTQTAHLTTRQKMNHEGLFLLEILEMIYRWGYDMPSFLENNIMLTEIGKELRKLRIDLGERMLDMAANLKISPAFLSAVEVGRKTPPDGFAESVIQAYKLTGEAADKVIRSFDRSRENFKLTANSMFARDTAGLLARKFDSLSEEQLQQIEKILNGKRGL
jgi:hypothetical protein